VESARVIKVGKGATPSQVATEHLRTLLTTGTLDALLVMVPSGGGRSYRHALVTDPAALEGADPFAPVMPVSGGTSLSRLTKLESPQGRVGAVLRPCEIAASIELAKLLQIRLDNIVVIGVDCPGTVAVQDHIDLVDGGQDVRKAMVKDPTLMREACRTCDWAKPQHFDMLMGTFGGNGKQVLVLSEDETLLRGLDDAPKGLVDARHKALTQLAADRTKAREEVFKEVEKEIHGPEAFAEHFETCIVCHNCMDQCPVCYCNECFFESQTFRYEADKMLRWARGRGALSMPTDKAMFHMGRMAHMVATCVACGMCTQACPVDINVGRVFKYVANHVQPEFDYKAGRSLDDPLPQATYLEDELEPR
jgi:formate dehydrogenase subunit beta